MGAWLKIKKIKADASDPGVIRQGWKEHCAGGGFINYAMVTVTKDPISPIEVEIGIEERKANTRTGSCRHTHICGEAQWDKVKAKRKHTRMNHLRSMRMS